MTKGVATYSSKIHQRFFQYFILAVSIDPKKARTHPVIFLKMYLLKKEAEALLSVTFDINISHIFPENSIEISLDLFRRYEDFLRMNFF